MISIHVHAMYTLVDSINIPRTVEEVWNFFSNPYNLLKITPPELRFRINSTPPETVYPGLLISYSVTPFGSFPMKWVSEITHVVPMQLFVDEQRFGPYKFWHHQHRFLETAAGITVVDEVNYQVPGGILAPAIHHLAVRSQLNRIFSFRRATLEKIFLED